MTKTATATLDPDDWSKRLDPDAVEAQERRERIEQTEALRRGALGKEVQTRG